MPFLLEVCCQLRLNSLDFTILLISSFFLFEDEDVVPHCPCDSDHVLQLSDLVKMEGYRDWIHLTAEFTLKSLKSWQVSRCS